MKQERHSKKDRFNRVFGRKVSLQAQINELHLSVKTSKLIVYWDLVHDTGIYDSPSLL